jgi:glyoxylase-like metal-dependent hydrolase (beta-lactamase superfamily II)
LSEGVSFVDPTASEGIEPDTSSCSRLIRVASSVLAPDFAAAHPTLPNGVTYTYLYLHGEAVVMIDGGWGRWVTDIQDGVPTVTENADARRRLEEAIGVLAPGKGLGDVAYGVVEHAHPDHTGQLEMVQAAKAAPLDIWVGSGDAEMLTNIDRLVTCTGQLPDGVEDYLPLFESPDFIAHTVPTERAASAPTDWVEVGDGVTLVAAPGHTPGSLLVYLPELAVTIGGNHLDPSDAGTTGDCGTPDEASGCPTECELYAESLSVFPEGSRALFVHPLSASE